jgi:hypothetical protein
MRLWFWAAAVVATLAPLAAAAPAAAQTAEERRQLDWVLARGQLLFGLDRAAWVATDDMLERIPDAEASGIRGYVVERNADGFLVTFYAREGERLLAGYRAQVASGGVTRPQVFQGAARPELTPAQARLARAVETVRGNTAGLQGCGRAPYNMATVPPSTPDGPIDVYLMTPQVDNAYPLGGHHRITLDASGREVGRRSFARSCIALSKAPPEAGAQVAGMVVSHLLDPVPTEIHVFSSMAAQMPVYVMIPQPRRLFEVTGRTISLVDEPRRP